MKRVNFDYNGQHVKMTFPKEEKKKKVKSVQNSNNAYCGLLRITLWHPRNALNRIDVIDAVFP